MDKSVAICKLRRTAIKCSGSKSEHSSGETQCFILIYYLKSLLTELKHKAMPNSIFSPLLYFHWF